MANDVQDLIGQLVDAGRTAVDRGLVVASGGNLSARRAGSDEFVVTATGTWLDRLTPGDFSIMSLDGEVRDGNPRPSKEWKLHQRSYLARPDINSVIHLHPQTAVLLEALGYEIRLITSDHANYVRKVVRVPFYPAGSIEIADSAAEAARESNVIIMAHHGSSALGDTVAMALRRALNLEEAAVNTFRCLTLGNTTLTFPPEWLAKRIASEQAQAAMETTP
jgi:L-fuculose-phosphate aldolase